MTETIETRVDRGFDFLTERLGPGWWDAVNVAKLNVGSCVDCVLGQLAPTLVTRETFGPPDFIDACSEFGWPIMSRRPAMYGFTLPPSPDIHVQYAMLTEAWRDRILRARTETPVVTRTGDRELVTA